MPKFYTEHCKIFIFLSQLFHCMYLEFSLTLWAQLHMADSVRVGKGGTVTEPYICGVGQLGLVQDAHPFQASAFPCHFPSLHLSLDFSCFFLLYPHSVFHLIFIFLLFVTLFYNDILINKQFKNTNKKKITRLKPSMVVAVKLRDCNSSPEQSPL